jgi:hypothetical protein
MAISSAKKTRKNYKKNHRDCLATQNKDAKKGTQKRCMMKTCRAKKYQSIYGSSGGGSIRSNRQLFY